MEEVQEGCPCWCYWTCNAYGKNAGAQFDIETLAHSLQGGITNANTQHQARVGAASKTTAERQGRLEAAQQGMGLTMPSQVAQPPTLDFALNNFWVQALAELRQNSVSPHNPSGGATAGLFLLVMELLPVMEHPLYSLLWLPDAILVPGSLHYLQVPTLNLQMQNKKPSVQCRTSLPTLVSKQVMLQPLISNPT